MNMNRKRKNNISSLQKNLKICLIAKFHTDRNIKLEKRVQNKYSLWGNASSAPVSVSKATFTHTLKLAPPPPESNGSSPKGEPSSPLY